MVVMFSVAVSSTGFMESQSYFNCERRASQFYPIVIAVSLSKALDQIDTKNVIMSLDEDKCDIRATHCACRVILIKFLIFM